MVCELYEEWPVECAAGVAGGSLRRRIETILTNRVWQRLSAVPKVLLTAAVIIAVAGPVTVGIVHAPHLRAEALTSQAARSFEVVSFKYAGTAWDHTTYRNNVYTMNWRPVEYKGGRLSADAPLPQIIQFAYSSMVTPYRQEVPDWMRREYYQIEAIAPAGTNLNGAREMLRSALAERLGFKYHLADRETPVYYLVRGSGNLKLARSTESQPTQVEQRGGIFKTESATVEIFAKFLTQFAGREVIDRTGLQGRYSFDVDWSEELQGDIHTNGPGLVIEEVKRLGLKLEPGKEIRKILVVDHANKIPTPN